MVAQPNRAIRSKRAVLQVVATSRFEKENPYAQELRDTAKYISQVGRGILASDESNMTTGPPPLPLRLQRVINECLILLCNTCSIQPWHVDVCGCTRTAI